MSRSAEREQFLADIICTAVEGGINYWSAVSRYKWQEGPKAAEVTVHDQDAPGTPGVRVTISAIARGLSILRASRVVVGNAPGDAALHAADGKRLYLSQRARARILAADSVNDAGELDADDCDIILQLSIFGWVPYG